MDNEPLLNGEVRRPACSWGWKFATVLFAGATAVLASVLVVQAGSEPALIGPTVPPLDTTQATLPYWLSNEPRYQNDVESEVPSEADIVIVGGGFVGMSIAYWLGRLLPEKLILVLEQRGLSSGATGRNAGNASGNLLNPSAADLERYPLSEWRREALVNGENAELLQEFLGSRQGATEYTRFRKSGHLQTFNTQEQAAAGKEAIETSTREGNNFYNASYLEGPACEQMMGAKPGTFTGCRYMPEAFQMWPARLVWTLADAAIESGVKVHTNTRVLGIDDVDRVVSTDRGEIAVRGNIIHATNAYVQSLLPRQMRERVPVRPVRGQGIATDGDRTPRLIDNDVYPSITSNSENSGDYYSVRPDGAIVGGGFRYLAGDGSGDVDVTNDITKDPVVARALREYIIETHPALQEFNVDTLPVSQEWTGIMGFSPDGYAQVGPMPGQAAGGNSTDYISVGYTGACMRRGFWLGRAMAQMVAGTHTHEEAVPALFRSGRFD